MIVKKVNLAICSLMIFSLASCALKPVASEYDFVKVGSRDIALDELGDGKVLIYNGANFIDKMDNTHQLNIWINDRALGQIRANEYVVVDFEVGKYQFEALRLNLFKVKTLHNVEISTATKVIEIEPHFTSTRLTLTNELPKRFEKFAYVEQTDSKEKLYQ